MGWTFRFWIAPVICVGMTTGGCAADAVRDGESAAEKTGVPAVTAPEASGGAQGAAGGFYPLATGNRWTHDRNFTAWVVSAEGETLDTYITRAAVERVQTGTETLFGREYVVERETGIQSDGHIYGGWTYFRQDRTGLYEADLAPVASARFPASVPDPAAPASLLARPHPEAWLAAWTRVQAKRAAVHAALAGRGTPGHARGGVLENEITRLAYPLHPGRDWTIRPDPFFGSTVEGNEVLDLPAGRFTGWRIRIESDLFGPDDEAHVWYGRSGYLEIHDRLYGIATGPGGEVVGTVIGEETEVLTGLDLVSNGR